MTCSYIAHLSLHVYSLLGSRLSARPTAHLAWHHLHEAVRQVQHELEGITWVGGFLAVGVYL